MKREQQQPAKRRQWLMIGLAVGGLLLILVSVLARRPNSPTVAINENDPQLVATGEEVYSTYCAACHGFDLEGEANWQQPNADGSFRAPPHDETGHTWHHDDAYLIESIKLGGARLEPNIGVSAMPAYDDVLSDQQIAAVLAYIKSHWPTEILEAQEAR